MGGNPRRQPWFAVANNERNRLDAEAGAGKTAMRRLCSSYSPIESIGQRTRVECFGFSFHSADGWMMMAGSQRPITRTTPPAVQLKQQSQTLRLTPTQAANAQTPHNPPKRPPSRPNRKRGINEASRFHRSVSDWRVCCLTSLEMYRFEANLVLDCLLLQAASGGGGPRTVDTLISTD
nr:hypothetical protein [Aspergillus sp.]